MKIKQTLLSIVFIALISVGITVFCAPITSATAGDPCGESTLKEGESCCGGVVTSVINCDQSGDTGSIENSGVWGLLLLAINILTGAIGIAAVGGLVFGGIMYSSAGGNPEKTKQAITIITNVVIGIVAYVLMYSVLNYLIPGGLFKFN